ncbi:SET domain-containing protein [Paraburkholderia youngii]
MRLRRITARRSPIHGRGLFALQPIAASYRVIEYKGGI